MHTQSVKINNIFNNLKLDIKWWNIYFLGKIYLFFTDVIDFHLFYNIAFFFLIVISSSLVKNSILRNITISFIAISLLYFDSYLPPFESLLNQLDTVLEFDSIYLLELANRFVDIKTVIGALSLCLAYGVVRRYLRITVIVLLTITYISLSQLIPSSSETQALNNSSEFDGLDQNQKLTMLKDEFFADQTQQQTHLASNLDSTAPFDMLFISVCSLSWDDLRLAKLSDHPLFNRFDITFTNYNSATSYSGPAVVRLLRAGCGQSPHSTLFDPANNQACYLFENLENMGFDTNVAMNHNGAFDNFTQLIRDAGHIEQPVKHFNELPPYQVAFDGSPIQRDYDVLQQIIDSKEAQSKSSVTLYNTISLHDGNRIVESNRETSLPSYKKRLKNLLDDLEAVYKKIEESGRNITVVFIPEHGSGLRGDKVQISGIRDIPSPAIVDIPVGVTFYGANLVKNSPRVEINAPSTHLALGQLTSNIIDSNTYGSQSLDLELLTSNLPQTAPVAQNSGVTMMIDDEKAFITLDDRTWSEYPSND